MAAALETIRHYGITLRIDGDRLLARGPLTDKLRALIRDHKPELMAALRGELGSPHLTVNDLPWVAARLRMDNGRAIATADVACALGFPALGVSRTRIGSGPRAWAGFITDATSVQLDEVLAALGARDQGGAR